MITAHDKVFIEIEQMPLRLLWIMDGEMPRSEMMSKLELTHRINFKKNYLDPAVESNWIEMTILGKPQSKKQKYRLTEVGKEEIKKIRK